MASHSELNIGITALVEGWLFGIAPIALLSLLQFTILSVFKVGRRDILVMTAFQIFGSFLGILTGGSREPAVSVFLPAAVTLVGGFATTLFKRDDEVLHRHLLPGAIISLVLGASFGAYFAAHLRQVAEQTDYLAQVEKVNSEYAHRLTEAYRAQVTNRLDLYSQCLEGHKAGAIQDPLICRDLLLSKP